MGRKIFVVVHGIGDQFEFESSQPLAERLTKYLSPEQVSTKYSFGSFSSAIGSELTVDLDGQDQGISSANEIDSVRWLPTNPVTGVTEIYWADICREDANSGFRLQETVSWAQSVVDRVRDMSSDKQNLSYDLVRSIFSELGHGLQMLGRFLAVAPFLGLPEVEIKTLLTQYLGDVQYVTEFRDIRNQIIKRFEARMASIKLEESDEIIIISHSEGTVVSFLGLLTSMSRSEALPNDHVDWRKRVAGLVTLGSPIDKHIIIWEDLWKDFEENGNSRLSRDLDQGRILWHNYYDFGDPVGYDLDEARKWLTKTDWDKYFDFKEDNDFGFTRYSLPGKAHVDYWTDDDLFSHIFSKVACLDRPPEPVSAPATRLKSQILSWVIPYLIAAGLMAAATYAMLTGGIILALTVSLFSCFKRKNNMKTLVQFGAVIVLALCCTMASIQPDDLENLLKVNGDFSEAPNAKSVWPKALPAIVSGAAFVYLWYLAVVVFDLTFVWHLYIKGDLVGARLKEAMPGFYRNKEAG